MSGAANRGVRVLFTGPSGTGKTLTARHLAARLQLDLYRVDLAAVVNKYLGETERNLDAVLTRAEELDVVLLFDEGDALLTRRTEVNNANDRYANLETDFLLQRLETFDGIVVVTTNAGSRIDPAFQRRIDVTVEFVPPDADQRRRLWWLHLPPGHDVSPALLDDAARRCELTGGQIRNAALHARLLGLERDAPITDDDLLAAVAREYRRSGASFPLAPPVR
jgi:SpoVK/Ycf46/Vps4 family AAA+-type ATPase